MRALPVDLPACFTQVKFIKIKLRFWLQAVEDGFFGHGPQTAVAAQAAGPGGELVTELVAVHNS